MNIIFSFKKFVLFEKNKIHKTNIRISTSKIFKKMFNKEKFQKKYLSTNILIKKYTKIQKLKVYKKKFFFLKYVELFISSKEKLVFLKKLIITKETNKYCKLSNNKYLLKSW